MGIYQVYDRKINELLLLDYKNNPYNIIDQYVKFTYTEGILMNSIFGEIVLLDAIDFPTLLPMIGEERLKAKFTKLDHEKSSPQDYPAIEFDMQIYRMDGKNHDGGSRKRQNYNLYFSSRFSFINMEKVVYAAYRGMKYSDMVKKIYEDYIKEDGPENKPLIVEETKFVADLYINGKSPLDAIQDICKKSVSAEDNGSLYVFYEGRDAYHFVTIQKLLKQEPKITLHCELKNILTEGMGSDVDLKRQMTNVDSYFRNSNFDIFNSIKSGEGVSSLLTIDPILRRYYYNEFDLRGKDKTGQDYWDKHNRISKHKPWTENNKMFANPRKNLTVSITDHEWVSDDIVTKKSSENSSLAIDEILLHRQSMASQIQKTIIEATLPGDPRIQAGDVVNFNVPEYLGASFVGGAREEPDKWLNGNYLVVAVSHVVENNEYLMGLRLARDGFSSKIFNRNPKDYSG